MLFARNRIVSLLRSYYLPFLPWLALAAALVFRMARDWNQVSGQAAPRTSTEVIVTSETVVAVRLSHLANDNGVWRFLRSSLREGLAAQREAGLVGPTPWPVALCGVTERDRDAAALDTLSESLAYYLPDEATLSCDASPSEALKCAGMVRMQRAVAFVADAVGFALPPLSGAKPRTYRGHTVIQNDRFSAAVGPRWFALAEDRGTGKRIVDSVLEGRNERGSRALPLLTDAPPEWEISLRVVGLDRGRRMLSRICESVGGECTHVQGSPVFAEGTPADAKTTVAVGMDFVDADRVDFGISIRPGDEKSAARLIVDAREWMIGTMRGLATQGLSCQIADDRSSEQWRATSMECRGFRALQRRYWSERFQRLRGVAARKK